MLKSSTTTDQLNEDLTDKR